MAKQEPGTVYDYLKDRDIMMVNKDRPTDDFKEQNNEFWVSNYETLRMVLTGGATPKSITLDYDTSDWKGEKYSYKHIMFAILEDDQAYGYRLLNPDTPFYFLFEMNMVDKAYVDERLRIHKMCRDAFLREMKLT